MSANVGPWTPPTRAAQALRQRPSPSVTMKKATRRWLFSARKPSAWVRLLGGVGGSSGGAGSSGGGRSGSIGGSGACSVHGGADGSACGRSGCACGGSGFAHGSACSVSGRVGSIGGAGGGRGGLGGGITGGSCCVGSGFCGGIDGRCGCLDGRGCRHGRRLFFLATGGQRSGSDQGGQDERLVHVGNPQLKTEVGVRKASGRPAQAKGGARTERKALRTSSGPFRSTAHCIGHLAQAGFP